MSLLVEHRVATTHQVASLLQIPERTALYRLRRLESELGLAGSVRPYTDKGTAPIHWWPTRVADAYIKGAPVPRGGERDSPSPEFVKHSASITEFYRGLVELEKQMGFSVVTFLREVEGREEFTCDGNPTAIVPDASISLRWGDAEYQAFVELDLGTMSMTRLGKKLGQYAAYVRMQVWKRAHLFAPALLFVTTTTHRAEKLIANFEAKCRWEEKQAQDSWAYKRLADAVMGACDLARRPADCLVEPVWMGMNGADGLRFKDLIEQPWLKFMERENKRQREQEESRAYELLVRSDPQARREQMQTENLTDRFEDLVKELGDPDQQFAMRMLGERTDPMTYVEREAFSFFQNRIVGIDAYGYMKIKKHQPITPREQKAIARLVSFTLDRERKQVAALYLRHPECPSLRRAIRVLGSGHLLDPWMRDRIEDYIRGDLKTLTKQHGRKLDYLTARKKSIEQKKEAAGRLGRLMFNPEQEALSADYSAGIAYCPVCEELVIPDRAHTDKPRCEFCASDKITELQRAQVEGSVEADGAGFWRVCHTPMPTWVTDKNNWPAPYMVDTEEGEESP